MSTDHATMKLGKLPPRRDSRTLRLAQYMDLAALPPIPAAWDWTTKVRKPFSMFDNDKLGDCTIASLGHGQQVWTSNASHEMTPTDKQIIAAYKGACGYKPGYPLSDRGGIALDVLKYAQKVGIAGNKIGPYVLVEHENLEHVRAAIFLFGGVYTGIDLPISAQRQDVWDVPSGGTNGRPGSWGGHMTWTAAYDAISIGIMTWNVLKEATIPFWQTYPDEVYAIVSPLWMRTKSRAPSGLNIKALKEDLALVQN